MWLVVFVCDHFFPSLLPCCCCSSFYFYFVHFAKGKTNRKPYFCCLTSRNVYRSNRASNWFSHFIGNREASATKQFPNNEIALCASASSSSSCRSSSTMANGIQGASDIFISFLDSKRIQLCIASIRWLECPHVSRFLLWNHKTIYCPLPLLRSPLPLLCIVHDSQRGSQKKKILARWTLTDNETVCFVDGHTTIPPAQNAKHFSGNAQVLIVWARDSIERWPHS